MFNKLYAHYKNSWDLEMRLTKANITYAELKKKNKRGRNSVANKRKAPKTGSNRRQGPKKEK